MFPDEDLYYSYSQCNGEDTFTNYDPNAEEETEDAPAEEEEEATDSTGSGAMKMAFNIAVMAVTTALMI